jgi:hypothetical protein
MPYNVKAALDTLLEAQKDAVELIHLGFWPILPATALGWGVAFKTGPERRLTKTDSTTYWAPVWISILARREEDKKQRDARVEYTRLVHEHDERTALLVGELLRVKTENDLTEEYRLCLKSAIKLENRSF